MRFAVALLFLSACSAGSHAVAPQAPPTHDAPPDPTLDRRRIEHATLLLFSGDAEDSMSVVVTEPTCWSPGERAAPRAGSLLSFRVDGLDEDAAMRAQAAQRGSDAE